MISQKLGKILPFLYGLTLAMELPAQVAEPCPIGPPAPFEDPAAEPGPFGEVLYSNGPRFNRAGSGAGGADESVLPSDTRGMTTLGFAHEARLGHRIADEFVIDSGFWQVNGIGFFAYQPRSGPVSTISGVNLRIWDGCPLDPASNVIWGDMTANRMVASEWSGIYRVLENAGPDSNRPVMENTVLVDLLLGPGTYWLDWQTEGDPNLAGPMAPPISLDLSVNPVITGNALQSLDGGAGYFPARDHFNSEEAQGFPFVIRGERQEGCGGPLGRASCGGAGGMSCNLEIHPPQCNPTCGSTQRITLNDNPADRTLIFISGALHGVAEISGTALLQTQSSIQPLLPLALVHEGDRILATSRNVDILLERLDIDETAFPPRDGLNSGPTGPMDQVFCNKAILRQEGGCDGMNNGALAFGNYKVSPFDLFSDSRLILFSVRFIEGYDIEIANDISSQGRILVEDMVSGARTVLIAGERHQFVSAKVPALSPPARWVLVLGLLWAAFAVLRKTMRRRRERLDSF